ncbi:MAG TPA: DUF4337 domain-containing protein [Hyphomicrobiaceae bacterium]|nr:DUF4337 domain-containing protein [Hyphomicrobiaceae bacterium]
MSHGAHGHGEGGNKTIAIFISILALCLAIAETMAKSAQTDALGYNIKAADTWAFFQAKTIRRTTIEAMAETMEIDAKLARDPATKQLLDKRIGDWRKTAARYRSEPETGEGSVELMAKAKDAERKRDLALAKYHHYEVSSAAFQIAIVLASAFAITTAIYLFWVAAGFSGVGVIFFLIGLLVPKSVHLF